MQHRSSANRRSKGFVLLYTLWLLLAGVGLFAALSSIVLQRARDVSAEASSLKRFSAMESAVHLVVHELLTSGKNQLTTNQTREVEVDGVPLRVQSQLGSSLIDLNSADANALAAMLNLSGITDATAFANQIRSARPIVDYAQLAALRRISQGELNCIRKHSSLMSGTHAAEPLHARGEQGSDALKSKQSENRADSIVASRAESVAGLTVRVLIQSASKESEQQLLVDLLITGRVDRPLIIITWNYSGRSDSATNCELKSN